MDLKSKLSVPQIDMTDDGRSDIPAESWRRPFSVRLSDFEFETIQSAAENNGEPISAFIRRAAMRAAGAKAPPKQLRRDLLARTVAENLGHLGRISSSSNQIARNGNMGLLRASEAVAALNMLTSQLAGIRNALVELSEDEIV